MGRLGTKLCLVLGEGWPQGCLNLDWENPSGPWGSLQAEGAWRESCKFLSERSAAVAGELKSWVEMIWGRRSRFHCRWEKWCFSYWQLSALLYVLDFSTMRGNPSPSTPMASNPCLSTFPSTLPKGPLPLLIHSKRSGELSLRPHLHLSCHTHSPKAFCFSSIPLGRSY